MEIKLLTDEDNVAMYVDGKLEKVLYDLHADDVINVLTAVKLTVSSEVDTDELEINNGSFPGTWEEVNQLRKSND